MSITVRNHELCDKLSEFDREPMAFFVLVGFREDCAEGDGLFEAGSDKQGLVKYVVFADRGQCLIFSGLHLRQCSKSFVYFVLMQVDRPGAVLESKAR